MRRSVPIPDPKQANPGAAPPEFVKPEQNEAITAALRTLLDGVRLTAEQTATAFEVMMAGRAHHAEMGALLALLATDTPTSAEILGAARIMREHVDPVASSIDPTELVDTAGTGGAPKTFNVSTAAAVVAAAAGARVAKHGNRSRTGRGSAEILRRLGIDVDAGRAVQRRCLEEAGVCFCFAIHHHPATRHVMPVRMSLGVPTIFNLLGPLTNPAGARRQLMGVYDRRFLRPIAEALAALGAIRATVVHSEDGLDEISVAAPTIALEVIEGQVHEHRIDPESLGVAAESLEPVTARDLDHAEAMVRGAIDGTDRGPVRAMTLLSAAATLVVAGKARDLEEGLVQAGAAIDGGRARETLALLAKVSQG